MGVSAVKKLVETSGFYIPEPRALLFDKPFLMQSPDILQSQVRELEYCVCDLVVVERGIVKVQGKKWNRRA